MFEVLLHEFFRCLCCDTNSFLYVVDHKPIWYHGYTCTFWLRVRLCFYVWLGLCIWCLCRLCIVTCTFECHLWMGDGYLSIAVMCCLCLLSVGVKPFGKAAILAWVSITVPLMQGIICSSDLNRCLLLYCTVGILCMSALCFSVCVGSGTIHIPLSTIHLLMRCFWSVL